MASELASRSSQLFSLERALLERGQGLSAPVQVMQVLFNGLCVAQRPAAQCEGGPVA